VFLGATPIGSPIVGWVGEAFGPRWAILLGSAATFAVAVGATVWAMRSWRVTLRYRVRRRPHLEIVYLDAPAVEVAKAA
jgi:MFS family permease